MSSSRNTKDKILTPKPDPGAAIMRIFRDIMAVTTGITPEIKERFADEGLCRRCGICCHSSIRIKDKMVLLKDLPCKYLIIREDEKTFCSVYNIKELTGWCHRISPESVRKQLFPSDCPYVEGISHYKGKIDLPKEEFEEIKPILKNIFKGLPRPEYVRPRHWDNFIVNTLELPRP